MHYSFIKKYKNNLYPAYILYDMEAESLPAGYVDIHVTVPYEKDIVATDASTWKHVTFAWYQNQVRKQIHCYIGVLAGKYVACNSSKEVRTMDSFNRYHFPRVVEDMIELGVLPKIT